MKAIDFRIDTKNIKLTNYLYATVETLSKVDIIIITMYRASLNKIKYIYVFSTTINSADSSIQ